MENKFYITTPIYYPTAKPHLGTAYTTIAADILARWNILLGKEVFFLTGTDEHGQKLEEAAKNANKDPKEYVDILVEDFKNAWDKLNIRFSGFIRTTDKKHERNVKEIINKILVKGDIYKGKYNGLYCVPCETYWTEKDLSEGKCPSCLREVKEIEEEAYFFKLSNYQDKLLEVYKKNPRFILPESKRNEMINRVREGLKDVSFTRSKFKWGVEFPIDPNFVLWVWPDALTNYLSGVDWPSGENFNKFWPADTHLIGKDILFFHAVIWPAMLLSANVELPKTIFAHGWWTVNGEKMSKSKGNVVDPLNISNRYCVDTLRYFLFRETPFGQDGDFSETSLIERHNNELANKLGNLVSRVFALAERYGIQKCDNKLVGKLKLKEISECMESYELDKALALIFEFIDVCNEYVQSNKVWETKDKCVLYELVDSIKAIAILLYPFIPSSSEKIASDLGFKIESISQLDQPLSEISIKKGEILFKKV
ncbi:MAG: methionine--tRNA ligase [archaeon]